MSGYDLPMLSTVADVATLVPTRAAFHGSSVPTYARVGRNVVPCARTQATGFGAAARATWLVRADARRSFG